MARLVFLIVMPVNYWKFVCWLMSPTIMADGGMLSSVMKLASVMRLGVGVLGLLCVASSGSWSPKMFCCG